VTLEFSVLDEARNNAYYLFVIYSIWHFFGESYEAMKALENKILNLLIAQEEGLKAREIMGALRPRVSQPTLWRALDALRAQGAVTMEGHARATRYHARARTDVAALRSRRMHESVAMLLVRDPSLRARALARLTKLREANPHGRSYHDRWHELLQGPLVETLRFMTEHSEMADALRKESPFSALVTQSERKRIFESTSAT
jgi:hypothetical protein